MIRTIALIACLVAMPLAAHAEGDAMGPRTARNTVYIELLGNALIYSLNYERFVTDDFNLRAGIEYFSLSASSGTTSGSANLFIFPLTVSYLGLSKGPHAFELGIGIDLAYASASTSSTGGSSFSNGTTVAGTAIAGYRYAPRDGGFNLRAALTPIFNSNGFAPWIGLALGFGL
jgi:hypothetical protein